MTRIVSSTNADALAAPAIEARVLVFLDFPSDPVYANDGTTDIVWNGNTYLGAGEIGAVESVGESVDNLAKPVTLTLSSLPEIVAMARDEVYQNEQALLMLGIIDGSTGQLLADPETLWEGRMDVLDIRLDAQLGQITLNLEHRLRREPRIARYTDPDQQLAYSGDTFFNMLQSIPGFVSQWGNEKARYGGPGGSIWSPGDNRRIRDKF